MLQLDHIAVTGETLEEAQAHVEQALGVALQPGGQHGVFHTHNALLGLEDGLYLEAIAIDGQAPAPDRPRWFDIDSFAGAPRLTNWICRCRDLAAVVAEVPEAGDIVDLERGDLTWRMAVPRDGKLPYHQCHPAVMQWKTGTHPAERLKPSGCRLTRLLVTHPEANHLRAHLAGMVQDDRLVFEPGAAGLRAMFDTPHGARVVE